MTTQRAIGQPPLSTVDVAAYAGGLAVTLALTHLVVGVLDDGRMSALAGLALAGVAVFVVVFLYLRRAAMAQRRYGYYLLHVIAFLLVNGSFALHALVRYSAGSTEAVTGGWRGVLFVMPLVWSVGLLVHTLGTLASRGYEHVEV